MKTCPNCRSTFEGDYCSTCGQKDVDLERPIFALVADVLRETFDVDGRALRTLRTLFRHPGLLTADFLAGRRRMYSPPFRLYLVISVAFFVFAAWLANQGLLLDPGQSVEQDAAGQARFMSEDLPKLMFVLLPVFALYLKIAMPGRLYFDHLVFSVHLHSAAYIVLAVVMSIEYVESLVADAVQLVFYVFLLLFMVVSQVRVYGKHWATSLLIAIAVLTVYLLSISAVIEGGSSLQILSD